MMCHLRIISQFAKLNVTIYNGIIQLKEESIYKKIILGPEINLLIGLFIIALIYTFLGSKLKIITFNLTLGAVIYIFMLENKEFTFNLPNILGNYLSGYLPEKIYLLLSAFDDNVIGYIVLTICAILFLSLLAHVASAVLYFTCILIIYLKFKEFFHTFIKDVPYITVYEIIGFILITIIFMTLLKWTLDYILNILFCIIGVTMLTSFTIPIIGWPRNYADFLNHYTGIYNELGLIDGRSTHFLLVIVILSTFSYELQTKLWGK